MPVSCGAGNCSVQCCCCCGWRHWHWPGGAVRCEGRHTKSSMLRVPAARMVSVRCAVRWPMTIWRVWTVHCVGLPTGNCSTRCWMSRHNAKRWQCCIRHFGGRVTVLLPVKRYAMRLQVAYACAQQLQKARVTSHCRRCIRVDCQCNSLGQTTVPFDCFSASSCFTVCENGRPQGGLLQESVTACL